MQKIPAWESVILVNDFGDSYWVSEIQDKCPEAFGKLQNLKNKYRDFHQWLEACEIYDQYIGEIIDYYGGEAIVEARIADGDQPEGWKPRPKLRMTKKNKSIIQSGVIPAKIDRMSDSEWYDAYSLMTASVSNDSEDDGIKYTIKPAKGKHKKVLNQLTKSYLDKSKTRAMTLTKRGYASDIISEYYNSCRSSYDAEICSYEDKSINELARMYEESKKTDEWVPVHDEFSTYGNELRYSNNRILSNKQIEMVDIMKSLHESGLNVLDKDHLKLMDKHEARLYKREIGESMLTNKERKKAAKQYKKYEKERSKTLQNRRDSDRALSRLLTENKGNANLTDDFTIEEFGRRGFKSY